MTKKLGTDYEIREEKRSPNKALSWAFVLLFPLVLVIAAVALGRYGSKFW